MAAENALRAGCQSGMEKRMGRNFKQVVRIAARRSGRERRWKMRLVRAEADRPANGGKLGGASSLWLVSLWAPRFSSRCKFLTEPPAQLRSGRVLSFGLGAGNRPVYPAGTPPRSRGLDLAGARLALGRAWPARAREKGFC